LRLLYNLKMDQHAINQRLSHITTLWSLVHQAHAEATSQAMSARDTLMQRYAGAVHRYLLGALRDPEAADDLFQEFCLKLLRGDFHRANPERGRFRDLLKTAVFHLIVDHQNRQRKRPLALDPERDAPAVAAIDIPQSEQDFLRCWREELMERTWLALAELEQRTGQPHHTILHFRTEQPLLSSADLAAQLGQRLGKTFTIDAVRQSLHRAREKFTDLLLEEIDQSLEGATPDRLDQELIDLDLWSYCKSALERRRSL